MQLFRGCLMTLGLILLLMVTSCVVGVSSCSRVVDPKQFARTVDETPDQTRSMVRDFLDRATYESGDTLKVDGKPVDVTVQDYSDGSIHLIAAQDSKTLLEITTVFLPQPDGDTRVEVVSDARPLAQLIPHGSSAGIHRAIRETFGDAFNAIDHHRVLPTGLLVSRLITEGRYWS